jgi:hypothetical protein
MHLPTSTTLHRNITSGLWEVSKLRMTEDGVALAILFFACMIEKIETLCYSKLASKRESFVSRKTFFFFEIPNWL